MAASSNPVRFGVNLTGPDRPYAELVATARVAEEAGFSTLAFTDRPPENNLEAWTTATAIGVQTQRVFLTHNTLNVPFRNTALLSKMATSLDVITGGRVILTLGAGAADAHFVSYGAPWASPGERFTDLRDAVGILRGTWANTSFTYVGRRERVENAVVLPKPVHGTIPIYVGALGPRMMRYTGATADGWLKNRGWPESLDELRGLVALLEEGAERAGRDPRGIRRVLNGAAAIGDAAAEQMRTRSRLPGAMPGSGNGLLGSVDQILETIAAHRAAGADTFHLAFPPEGRHDQMRQFGENIIPRAASL
jgi:alkanesulfonate monooxygenase SsuD/methylene tetrahydromethanopterin reductase-like flavin-dependent oxidoreductase (luciferase family)